MRYSILNRPAENGGSENWVLLELFEINYTFQLNIALINTPTRH